MNKLRNFKDYTAKILIENEADNIDLYDLSNCNNPYLKSELAYYITKKKLHEKNMATKETYIRYFARLIDFFNQINLQYKEVYSILDFDIEELENEYKAFLNEKGISTTKTVKVLLASMNKVNRAQRSGYLSLLITVYKIIEEYVNLLDKSYFERDIWNLRKFPIKIDTSHTSKENFNFKDITQEKIKYISKKYIHNRLQYQSPSTCHDRLVVIRKFSNYLHDYYPEVKSLNDITYEIMEDYYIWLGVSEDIGHNRRSSCISQIEKFLNFTMIMQWPGCPEEQIIIDFDTSEIRNLKPNYLKDEEVMNLNAHLGDMDNTLARMTIILENIGMRIIECCMLKQDCLRIGINNQHFVKYRQYKTQKYNTVPVSEEVYLTIDAAITDVQKEFNEYNYVFLNSIGNPLTEGTFSYRINQICYKYQIQNKEGHILHVKPNVFRGTVATRYVDLGVSLEVIRKLLGQSSLGAIYHYVEGNEAATLEYMEPLLEDRAKNIMSIGNREEINAMTDAVDEETLPLSNGYCMKKMSTGICDKANTCYECAMFKPTPQHYNVYVSHLKRLRYNIQIAELNGFERQIQVNKRTEQSLLKIIRTINPEFEKE